MQYKAIKHASDDIVKILSGGVLVWVSEHYANERLEAAINAIPLNSGVRVSETDKFPPSPTGNAGRPIFKFSFMSSGHKIPGFEDVQFKLKSSGNFERTVKDGVQIWTAYVTWNECCLTLIGTQYSKTVYFASRYDKK